MGWVSAPRESSALRYGRKIIVAAVGATIILFGLAIAFLPGPGPLVLIPLGIAVLAIEFAWARRVQRRIRDTVSRTSAEARPRRTLRRRANRP